MALRGSPIIIPGTTESGINQAYEWGGKRSLRVYTDPDDDENYVRTSLPPPYRFYSPHPTDAAQIITDLRVKDLPDLRTNPVGGGLVREWVVDVTYGLWTPLLASLTGDPISRPPLFRFQCSRVGKVIDKDTEDKPIVNSAGDPFNPPVEIDAVWMILYVNRNEANPNFFNIFNNWVDHINQSDWNGFPARTLKVGPVNLPERLYSQLTGSLYYPMEYSLEFNPETWDKYILDQGYRELDPADDTGATQRNILAEGTQVNEPALLNGKGVRLPPPINKDDAVYLKFQVYKDLDFTALGLNNLFANSNAPQGGGGLGNFAIGGIGSVPGF